jgi:hypothetical protein
MVITRGPRKLPMGDFLTVFGTQLLSSDGEFHMVIPCRTRILCAISSGVSSSIALQREVLFIAEDFCLF